MTPDGKCSIWDTNAQFGEPDNRDGTVIISDRAGGSYFITGTAQSQMNSWSAEQKVLLTDFILEQRRLGVMCPEVTSMTMDDVKHRRTLTPVERADNLLRGLSLISKRLGDVSKFYRIDNSKSPRVAELLLAHTSSTELKEVITLAEYCSEKGWLGYKTSERASGNGNDSHEVMLKPPGYVRLGELDGTNTNSHQAFVAMWFSSQMNLAYSDGIKPAVEGCGYSPMRIDKKEHIEKIDDRIISEIRRSRFLVADFSCELGNPRGGVYYEAGFAQGLNIPVIWTCREDCIPQLHFDTRQFNHIVWKEAADLRELLAVRIAAVIGDGPLMALGR